MTILARRAVAANGAFDAVKNFYFHSRYGERRTDPGIADFTFGNPHEMPLDGIVAAIREGAVPHNKDWFAYKTSEEAPQAFLAREVGRELGLRFDPPDIALTAGAFAAISVGVTIHSRIWSAVSFVPTPSNGLSLLPLPAMEWHIEHFCAV